MQEKYNIAQKDLQKSVQLYQELRTRIQAVESSREELASQMTDAAYELQLLRDEINVLKEEKAVLMEENYAPTIPEKVMARTGNAPSHLPSVNIMRSTVAEEPDHSAQDLAQEPLFPGV